MSTVLVTGSFDNLRSGEVRFLEEAAKLGSVHIALWPDDAIFAFEGKPPRFPEEERLYLLQSLRFVERVIVVRRITSLDDMLEVEGAPADAWVVNQASDTPSKRVFAKARGMQYHVITDDALMGFPASPFDPSALDGTRKRVMVTGCYDWFHSGHVRFFEEASAQGDLYVVVGHDANVRLLKGQGHPLQSQAERLYMVQAVRYVSQALISTGHGWMDAEPEITLLKPHFYVVNEDGDKPEKRAFCAGRGIEYVVLKRIPKAGLPRRESRELRGY